jgi:tyrosinase
VQAVLALKAAPSPYDPTLSYDDQFVAWHVALAECDPLDPLNDHRQNSHGGPMFLPWHREFLILFENALREVSGNDVTLPYWDWTEPAGVASVFADDFMGGDGDPDEGYAVTSGPFRKGNWELNVHNYGIVFGTSATRWVTRHFGTPGTTLPTRADVAEAFAAPLYDVPPFDDTADSSMSFRNAIEGFGRPVPVSTSVCTPDGVTFPAPLPSEFKLHNVVHIWVGGIFDRQEGLRLGGTMSIPLASPNDPVFFLHHANIDRLWAEWQQAYGVHTYAPTAGYRFNNAGDSMRPFDESGIIASPEDVADIAGLGYVYTDPETGQPASQATAIASRPSEGVSGRNPLFCRIGP